MTDLSTIRLAAPNDRNGNPRRIYVTLRAGDAIATYDAGYKGDGAITNPVHRKAYQGVTFAITATEYKEWLNYAKGYYRSLSTG